MLTACGGSAATPGTSEVAVQPTGAPASTVAAPTTTAPTQPPGTDATTATSIPTRSVPAEPRPDPAPPDAGQDAPAGDRGVAVAVAGGMPYAAEPGGELLGVAHEGLVFGVEERDGDWFGLRDQCNERIWAQAGDVAFTPRNENGVPSGMTFDDAVVIVDPGHGGPNLGATGPTGLAEPVVNLDIARRLRDLLETPHSVDPATGIITDGDAIPAAGRVWVTRVEGPEGADIDSGLVYRATLATEAGAHALVSIHNNADPDGPFDGPGSEAFYGITDPESRRLAGLVVEEMRFEFARFEVAWVGDTDAGAKYRLRSDGTTDYYGLLRGAGVPSVIAEGAFISSPDEEALLRTAGFRQAYADAVYRALVRFITTDDPGSGFTEPYPRTIPAGSGAPAPTCRVPEQE